jgi:hypothetical protein
MKLDYLPTLLCVATLLPALVLFVEAQPPVPKQGSPQPSGSEQPLGGLKFPYASKLSYQVVWRMLTAGEAVIQIKPGPVKDWNISLDLTSAGLVSRLYRVQDTYKASTNAQFCGENAVLDGQEGKRRFISHLTFDNARHKVVFSERNLTNNTTQDKELNIAPCTYEILGALASLRLSSLPPGKSIVLPITSGHKTAQVRVEAQARENLQVAGKSYSATRYEAFLFDNVLYKRKGRLFIWMTDGPEHLPVRLRIQLGFPIGSILVELEKQEKL